MKIISEHKRLTSFLYIKQFLIHSYLNNYFLRLTDRNKNFASETKETLNMKIVLNKHYHKTVRKKTRLNLHE